MTRGTRKQLAAALAAASSVAVAVGGMMLPLTAGAAPADAAAARAPALLAASAQGVGAGYWHTSGNQILDSNGNPVRIAGINWYGFETPDEIAHGLWVQDYHTIINDIAALGYNTIRIPFSNQMVETPIVPQNLSFSNNTGGCYQRGPQGAQRAAGPAEDRGRRRAGRAEGHPRRSPLRGRRVRRAGRPVVHQRLPQLGLGQRLGDAGEDVRGQPDGDRVRPAQRAASPTGDTYAQGATWALAS